MTNSRAISARAVVWVAIDKWGARLSTLIAFAILARLLQPSEFGLAAIVLAIVSIAQVFVDAGLATALIRAPRLSPQLVATANWMNFALAGAITALTCLLAPVLSQAYGAAVLAPMIMVQSIKLLIAAFASVPMATLQREQRFKALSIRRLAGNAGGMVAGISIAVAGGGAWSLIAQSLTSSAIATVILLVTASHRPFRGFSRADARALLAFGLPTMGSGLITAISTQGYLLVLAIFLTHTQIGFASLANQIATVVVDVLANVVAVVALPALSSISSRVERANVYARTARVVSAFTTPALIAVAATAAWFVPVIFGSQYLGAAPYVAIVALGTILAAPQSLNRSLLYANGHPLAEAIFNGASVALQLALVFALAPLNPVLATASILVRSMALLPYQTKLIHDLGGASPRKTLIPLVQHLAASAPVGLAAYLASCAAPRPPAPLAITLSFGAAFLIASTVLLVVERQLLPLLRLRLRR